MLCYVLLFHCSFYIKIKVAKHYTRWWNPSFFWNRPRCGSVFRWFGLSSMLTLTTSHTVELIVQCWAHMKRLGSLAVLLIAACTGLTVLLVLLMWILCASHFKMPCIYFFLILCRFALSCMVFRKGQVRFDPKKQTNIKPAVFARNYFLFCQCLYSTKVIEWIKKALQWQK